MPADGSAASLRTAADELTPLSEIERLTQAVLDTEKCKDLEIHDLNVEIERLRRGLGDRETMARTIFVILHPREIWNDFDERYEARGGYHPMQLKAFEIADAIIASHSAPA